MNFTSYSQIEQAYNQLQFDLALSENTSLFSEMHNYISENIVELPYSEDVFTEAKDGKNFLERIWDFIVGVWNAIKKFFGMLFRAVKQLFTGKSETEKLIEKLENNSEEIADNIQNKPAAEVVKVLTEMFVPEKKEEVKKESVSYLSEASKPMDLYNSTLKNKLEKLATTLPKGIKFQDYIDDPQNKKQILSILNDLRKSYGLSEAESIPKRIAILMENRLKVNGLLLDLADLIYSEEGNECWYKLGKDSLEKMEKSHMTIIKNKNDLAGLLLRFSFDEVTAFKGIATKNEDFFKMLSSDSAFSRYLTKLKRLYKITSENFKFHTYTNYNAFHNIWRSLDVVQTLCARSKLIMHQIDLVRFIKMIEKMDTIIARGGIGFADSHSKSPNHLTYYFQYRGGYFNKSGIWGSWSENIDIDTDDEFKKPNFQGINIDIQKYKTMINEKVKPALKVPIEEVKNSGYNPYKNEFDSKRDREKFEPQSINDKPLYYIPDTYANSKESIRGELSNSLMFYIKNINDSLRILNDFRGKINVYTFKQSLLHSLYNFVNN